MTKKQYWQKLHAEQKSKRRERKELGLPIYSEEERTSRKAKREAKRQLKNEAKVWTRAGKTNGHHIFNKIHGGTKTPSNMLRMDVARHNAFHFLFKNMSFREVAALLIRTCEMRGQEDGF